MSPLLLGAVLGGAAMYLFDPDKGKRRRALIRDQAVKAQTNVRDFVDEGTRDLKNRGTAAYGRTRATIMHKISGKPPTDDVLAERVRSKMGRFTAHPGAIEVSAAGGEVTLTGSILSHEHDGLIEGVSLVPGVTDIRDQLGVYETAEGISELQGDGRQRRPLTQDDWAPGTRLVGGAAGTTLTLYALTRHSKLAGFVAFASGVALLARTVTNRPLLSAARGENEAGAEQHGDALEGSRSRAANEESA